MSATSRQQDGEQPAPGAEADEPLEPPDGDEPTGAQTRVVIRVERTEPMEAWVIAQEFCGCLAGGKQCKTCGDDEE